MSRTICLIFGPQTICALLDLEVYSYLRDLLSGRKLSFCVTVTPVFCIGSTHRKVIRKRMSLAAGVLCSSSFFIVVMFVYLYVTFVMAMYVCVYGAVSMLDVVKQYHCVLAWTSCDATCRTFLAPRLTLTWDRPSRTTPVKRSCRKRSLSTSCRRPNWPSNAAKWWVHPLTFAHPTLLICWACW